jgi:hypothetical protein
MISLVSPSFLLPFRLFLEAAFAFFFAPTVLFSLLLICIPPRPSQES